MTTIYAVRFLDIEGRSTVSIEYFIDKNDAIAAMPKPIETKDNWTTADHGRVILESLTAWNKGEYSPHAKRVRTVLDKLTLDEINVLQIYFNNLNTKI